ncbi:ABC transporter substrate-binding protein [Gulosibacter sp. ACHW.36C]|uniref:ABC transporter substrate-binding protein n=1 Tax=Gulosibacter sediminis TaxID=1729695 RepID=A0ABY4N2I8_9MICO|nr:ABC transporter substrate-binding protein [Gulosibacter sediminis]UQN15851.1 ABC transporter substrate-binding protein [Gulosibacter sediminis]
MLAVGSLALSACSNGGGDAASTEGAASGDSFKVGVIQLVQHPALDAATAGFEQAFTDAGIDVEFDVQVANGEQSTAATIAAGFAGDPDIDLVLAVATPAAQSAATAITNVPVLFTAVTDPVAADLVASAEEPGGNVTGTTDLNPVADQIDLITQLDPSVESVGVVYSSGEVNSQVQVDLAQEKADELGLELKTATVTNVGEVPTALDSLGDVDSIYVPTDNTVVSGIDTVLTYAADHQVPVVSGDTGPVESGAVATLGLDYTKLGVQTGEMAIRILQDGEDPATMSVEEQTEFDLVVNPAGAEAVGLEIPQELLDEAATVVE